MTLTGNLINTAREDGYILNSNEVLFSMHE